MNIPDIRLIPADQPHHWAIMEALGRQIVPTFYVPYLGADTSEYMMESGHTAAALAKQAQEGYRHYLLEKGGQAVGYFALHEEQALTLMLTHLYLLPQHRGRGLGTAAMGFVWEEAAAWPASAIELYVLRANGAAVGFYRKHGFVVVEELTTTLANGGELEDYLMRWER